MTNDQRKEIRELVRHLVDSIRDTFYSPAHEAAENVCSGVVSCCRFTELK
ncbi:hypothetical protein OG894_44325 (plasmid) [Streptomyces sp. NBC_01724]|nr:hypothetical protein [Streptomyces sp. NBC_01724]